MTFGDLTRSPKPTCDTEDQLNMKKLIARSIVVAVMIAPMLTRAELLIYKGIERETDTGGNNSLRINSKAIVIIDHDTGNFGRILYTTINRVKRRATNQYTNAHIVQVVGLRGKTSSIITRIPTECDMQENPGHEGVYMKGTDATLAVGTGANVIFPRTLTDNGVGFHYSTSSGEPIVTDGTLVLVFSKAETVISNGAGETLDAAFARHLAYIESLGYLY